MKIDSHQHFWKYDPVRHAWIDGSMQVIQRDFMPEDLLPKLEKKNITGCIAVQADESITETEFLLNLSSQHDWIRKVVGWIDFDSKSIEGEL